MNTLIALEGLKLLNHFQEGGGEKASALEVWWNSLSHGEHAIAVLSAIAAVIIASQGLFKDDNTVID